MFEKTKGEYEVLTKSDSMWFCTPCKANVEENITTGLNIENMCDKIIQMFESRLIVIEQKIDTKCDESKVRDIVKDELSKAQDQIKSYADVAASESSKRVDKVEMTTVVVDEINERKKRENNIVIFGLQESESDEKKERGEHDLRQIKEMFEDSKVQLEGDAIKNCKRLGRYDSKKPSRPLLATLEHTNQKITLFKNFHYAKQNQKYENVSVSNDLTQTEREKEKKLWSEAKRQQSSDVSGDYMYKVRGPPWARRIVKIKK